MAWYTVRQFRKCKVFNVNVNTTFNINSILYPTTWISPEIFYTYNSVSVYSNWFDTSIKLANLGGGNYQLQTDGTVSGGNCKVVVYEGDILNESFPTNNTVVNGTWQTITRIGKQVLLNVNAGSDYIVKLPGNIAWANPQFFISIRSFNFPKIFSSLVFSVSKLNLLNQWRITVTCGGSANVDWSSNGYVNSGATLTFGNCYGLFFTAGASQFIRGNNWMNKKPLKLDILKNGAKVGDIVEDYGELYIDKWGDGNEFMFGSREHIDGNVGTYTVKNNTELPCMCSATLFQPSSYTVTDIDLTVLVMENVV